MRVFSTARRRSWARVAWLWSTAPVMPLAFCKERAQPFGRTQRGAERRFGFCCFSGSQVSGSLGEVAVKVSKFKNLPLVAWLQRCCAKAGMGV